MTTTESASEHSIIYHEEGNYLEVVISGNHRVSSIVAIRDDLRANPHHSDKVKVLWDIREASIRDVSMQDIKADVAHEPSLTGKGIAILWKTEFQFAVGRQFAGYANLDPGSVLLTSNEAAARDWASQN